MNFGMFLNPLGQIQAGFETLDGSNHFVTSQNKLNDNKCTMGTSHATVQSKIICGWSSHK
jgi:hypothetical protein